MDNLAHTLFGAAMGQAGLKRRTGLGMATLMIGANLPDVDGVMMLLGDALAHRRGHTHGVVALVVLPFILTGLMVGYDRLTRRRNPARPPVIPRQILLLAALSILSHPLLDWLNTYGMRWLMPLSGRWFYGDALFIVDPWLWSLLFAGVVLAHWWGRTPARWALGAVTVYALLMVGSSAVGRRLVAGEVRAIGGEPLRVMISPRPVNPFRRLVVVEEPQGYRFGELWWSPGPDIRLQGELLPHNRSDPSVAVAARSDRARAFHVWSRFPFYRIERRADRTVVLMDDARYSNGRSISWAAVRVVLPPDLAAAAP